jgi:hypothetical protein
MKSMGNLCTSLVGSTWGIEVDEHEQDCDGNDVPEDDDWVSRKDDDEEDDEDNG